MTLARLFPLLVLLLLPCGHTPAVGGGKKGEAKPGGRAAGLYAEGTEMVKAIREAERAGELEGEELQTRYRKALRIFKRAYRKDSEDPDVLNMTAYCLRKTGEFDQAIALYRRALEAREDFPQAREYLAEAYLDLARQQVGELRRSKEGKAALGELVGELEALTAEAKAARAEAAAGDEAGRPRVPGSGTGGSGW